MKLPQDKVGAINEFIQEVMAEEQIPGLAIAITHKGETIYSDGFGKRNENGDPVTENTIMGIASITKSFTGLAISQLAEAGRLRLTDPVIKYLPDFSVPSKTSADITIQHLLTHTSGLPLIPALTNSIRGNTRPEADEEDQGEIVPINTYHQLLKYIAKGDYKMLEPVGEYFSYSNDAYALLGAIVEAASGQLYDEYVKEHILQPLDMNRSAFKLAQVTSGHDVTTLYYKKDERVLHSNNWQEAPPYLACGWLRSCAADMIKYVQMFIQKGEYKDQYLVSPQSISEMTMKHKRYAFNKYYGYGLSIQPDYEGSTLVEHGGSLKGVASNLGFIPEEELGAIVLCNLSGAPAAKIWLGIINIALGLPAHHPRYNYPESEWTVEKMQSFTGSYKGGEGFDKTVYVVKVKDNRLVLHADDNENLIKPITSDIGLVKLDGKEQEIRFYFDGDDKAMGIGRGVRIYQRV